jgi:hypothetical protein
LGDQAESAPARGYATSNGLHACACLRLAALSSARLGETTSSFAAFVTANSSKSLLGLIFGFHVVP